MTLTAVRLCVVCGASAQMIKCCLWHVSHTQPFALPLKFQEDAYQKMPLTWLCSCRELSCTQRLTVNQTVYPGIQS